MPVRPSLETLASLALAPLITLLVARVDAALALGIVLLAEIAGPDVRLGASSISAGELCLIAALLAPLPRVGGPASAEAARRERGDLVFIALLFLGLVCATAATLAHAAHPVPVARETAKAVEYGLATILGYRFARRTDEARALLALGVVGVAAACSALLEIHTGSASVFRAGARLVPRVAGFLEGPNQLGGFLGLLLPFYAVGAVVHAHRAAFVRVMHAASALCVLALFLTFSRAGILTGCLELGAALVLVRGRPGLRGTSLTLAACILGGLAAAYGVAGAGILHLGTVGNEGDTGAVGHRGELWRAALGFWRESPLLGIGAGNFELELARAGLPRVRTHANSLYLQSLAEGGIVLLAATLGCLVAPLRRLAGARRASPFVAAAAVALCGYAGHQLVDTLNFYPKIGVPAWLLVGAALGYAARAATFGITSAAPRRIR